MDKSKFKIDDIVRLNPIKIDVKILEVVLKNNKFFYKVDWTPYGYNKILNTVPLAESAMTYAT